MRNSHEALRAACREMEQQMADASGLEAFRSSWPQYQRVLKVHAEMEDVDMFPLIDRTSGSPLNLGRLHEEDERLTAAVDAALPGADAAPSSEQWEAVKAAFASWLEFHMSHFSEE